MPTKRHGWVRRSLRDGHATVLKRSPFTIRLTYDCPEKTQPITLGIDAGYATVGFSAITEVEELFAGEFTLLVGVSERLKERQMYRRIRRNRLRHRKRGFLKDTKNNGWLAPSTQYKLDSHIRIVEQIKGVLPVTRTIVEVANFDIQKIRNQGISGSQYQQGEQYGFENLREYILHRDHHTCQNPDCTRRSKILQVHHIGFWRHDRSNRPSNLVTLCINCHASRNHNRNGFLYGWRPELKAFREATFMSTVRWKLVNHLQCTHTYGHITKSRRIANGLEKSHQNDAFVISEGTQQDRCVPFDVTQRRRNNRSLQKFYDAQYIDLRDGTKKAGKDLCSQRRTRSRENIPESLRPFRAHKIKIGRVAIRRKRHPFQPGDLVKLDGKILCVKGTISGGTSVLLSNKKTKIPRKLERVTYGKGIKFEPAKAKLISQT